MGVGADAEGHPRRRAGWGIAAGRRVEAAADFTTDFATLTLQRSSTPFEVTELDPQLQDGHLPAMRT